MTSLAGHEEMDLCGQVPTDQLAVDLADGWRQTVEPSARARAFSGVFSQTEYFRNLLVLARQAESRSSIGPHAALSAGDRRGRLAEFRELLKSRPLIFVGYGIPEVDVDIINAMQQYRQRDDTIKRWQLMARRDQTMSSDEWLRQMGIDPCPFDVPAIGYAALPGKLGAARRHEWRSVSSDPLGLPTDKDWRKAL